MIWFGFKGLSANTSYILNISNKLHDTLEVERKPLSFLEFLIWIFIVFAGIRMLF